MVNESVIDHKIVEFYKGLVTTTPNAEHSSVSGMISPQKRLELLLECERANAFPTSEHEASYGFVKRHYDWGFAHGYI